MPFLGCQAPARDYRAQHRTRIFTPQTGTINFYLALERSKR